LFHRFIIRNSYTFTDNIAHFKLFQYCVQICKKASASGGLRPETPYWDYAPGPYWGTSVSVYSRLLRKESPQRKRNQIHKNSRRDRGITGTNSWLDETDKNFGPDLPLLFKLHEFKFGQLILRKIITFVATRCQILRKNAPNSISAGLCPRPRWA